MIAPAAFAAGSNDAAVTTLTVSTGKPTVPSGRPVNFTAQLAPNKVGSKPVLKPTGTVSWTIVGSDSSTVACTASAAILPSGKAKCSVAPGLLLANASPYTVTATYSGDDNFATATGSTSETVTSGVSRMKITLDAKPTSGNPSVVTVVVRSGVGSVALTGLVGYANNSTSSTTKAYCSGIKSENFQHLVQNVATCDLPAGWIVVPAATPFDKRPRAQYFINVTYTGDGNFTPVFKTITGKISS
jgi:hypothetical protein